jgi:hypothetical protein
MEEEDKQINNSQEVIREQSSEDIPQAPADNPTDTELGTREINEEDIEQ